MTFSRGRLLAAWYLMLVATGASAQIAVPAASAQATLRLTLEDAVRRAIEHNPELAIVKLGTDVEAARVDEAKSAFIPILSSVLGHSSVATPPSSVFFGTEGVTNNDSFSLAGVRQRLKLSGGTWSASWAAARTTTNDPFASFDPTLRSGLDLGLSQPLLRDLKIDLARAQYIIAKRNRNSSELHFREAVVQTIAAVKQAYWTYKATVANIAVQQRSLELAQELARQNRIRVDAGQIPPVDLVQAEAEVAQRRENLISAKTASGDAEDALRRLIVDPSDTSFWQVRLDPVEDPSAVRPVPDIDAAVARALEERYDIARAGVDLANAATTVDFLRNQRLPDVRLEAFYRGTGLGGTELLRGPGLLGDVIGTRRIGLGNTLGQPFSNDFPTWTVGVTVDYPLGRSYDDASVARADAERRQATQRIASLRVQAAEAVRHASRQIQGNSERIDAATAGATLARERVTVEQRRFEAGLSTTFLVTQAQRDLLEAEVGLLQARLDYETALVNFEGIQLAPPLGTGETVGISGAEVVFLPTPTPRGIFRETVLGF